MTKLLVITRITHSCHLIQIGSLTVLTDPWLTQRSTTGRADRPAAGNTAAP